jgi:hypothetical protein
MKPGDLVETQRARVVTALNCSDPNKYYVLSPKDIGIVVQVDVGSNEIPDYTLYGTIVVYFPSLGRLTTAHESQIKLLEA